MDRIADLARVIRRHAPPSGMAGTAIKGLSLIRADAPTMPVPGVYEASLCLIAQGAKRVSLGERSVVYDPAHYLVVSVDLPLTGHVTQASVDLPYLGCKIDFDLAVLAELVMADSGQVEASDLPTLAVYPGEPELIDAAYRLVRLLDDPARAIALAPLTLREIMYRLLTGRHGAMLRHMATPDTRLNRIARAIASIREGYGGTLRTEVIADAAGMSSSSLHAHFKAVTGMTPLEYQKQLRLQEARRLMLAEGSNAGAAGFAVGYESQSQFSKEYRRLFGAPPRRDVERMAAAKAYIAGV